MSIAIHIHSPYETHFNPNKHCIYHETAVIFGMTALALLMYWFNQITKTTLIKHFLRVLLFNTILTHIWQYNINNININPSYSNGDTLSNCHISMAPQYHTKLHSDSLTKLQKYINNIGEQGHRSQGYLLFWILWCWYQWNSLHMTKINIIA